MLLRSENAGRQLPLPAAAFAAGRSRALNSIMQGESGDKFRDGQVVQSCVSSFSIYRWLLADGSDRILTYSG